MRTIALLDPSVGTRNLGDQIIYEAVRRELELAFPNCFICRISTHEFMLWESRRIISECDYVVVGGSNLLKSKMEWNTQWKLSPWDLWSLRKVLLLACGWRHYDSTPTPYTRLLYKTILDRRMTHSVRDGYTARQLDAAGVSNVSNTACVTMWNLTAEHCAGIPVGKSADAVVTVTAYHPDAEKDRVFLHTVMKSYRQVFLFVQQPDDLAYAQGLAGGRLTPLPPSVKALDEVLKLGVDYIGTRLHGGIRALQEKSRTLVLSIDNRAREIASDTGLPTVERGDGAALDRWIQGVAPTVITLPLKAISHWRRQFGAQPAELVECHAGAGAPLALR